MTARRWAGAALVAAALAASALAEGFPAMFSKYPIAARLKSAINGANHTDMWFDGERALFLTLESSNFENHKYTLLSKNKVTKYTFGQEVQTFSRADTKSYNDIFAAHFGTDDMFYILTTGGDANWTEYENPDPASKTRIYTGEGKNSMGVDVTYWLIIGDIDRPYQRTLWQQDSSDTYSTELVSLGCKAVPQALYTDVFNGEAEVTDTGCTGCYENPEGECEQSYTTLMADGHGNTANAFRTTSACKRHLVARYDEIAIGGRRLSRTEHLYVAGAMQRYETTLYGRSSRSYGVSVVTRNGHTFAYQHTFNGPVCMTDGFSETAEELFMHSTGALYTNDNSTLFVEVNNAGKRVLLAYNDGNMVIATGESQNLKFIQKERIVELFSVVRGDDLEQICHVAPFMFTLPSSCRWGNKKNWDLVTREPTLAQIVEGTNCPPEPEDMGSCSFTTNMPVPWLPCSYQVKDGDQVVAESQGRFSTFTYGGDEAFYRRDLKIIGRYTKNFTAVVEKAGDEFAWLGKVKYTSCTSFNGFATWYWAKSYGENGKYYDYYRTSSGSECTIERNNPLNRGGSITIEEADVELKFQKIISAHPEVDVEPTDFDQTYDQMFIAPDLADASKYCDLLETYPSWNITA